MLFNDYYLLFMLAGEHYENKTEHSVCRLHYVIQVDWCSTTEMDCSRRCKSQLYTGVNDIVYDYVDYMQVIISSTLHSM